MSYVINAGVRDPLLLASEVATLDVVSDGRAELGIGAGHTPAEWAMTGRTRPPPAGRVKHLMAVTTVVRELLAGRAVPAEAADAIAEVRLTGPCPAQEPVPVLVGGGNPALLRWGGAHATAVDAGPIEANQIGKNNSPPGAMHIALRSSLRMPVSRVRLCQKIHPVIDFRIPAESSHSRSLGC
jgi:alkanesulfonate monooxygenase SsuD/methylene tetrahydromethanopterin reductase-like flavin-dependent oxidoreductase (luciferase family)